MSMTYPLIHPYGEDGYRLRIPFRGVTEITPETKQLTMLQYYSFRFQQRLNEGHTLLRAGRLLQQYIVDSYMAIEEERFHYVRKYQNKLRTHLYSGLMDAIHRGDSDCTKVGKSIILPSSHTWGPRYRAQNYQDAMAICKWAGYPDLFLTFTCNPKWPEIQDMLNLIGQKDDENRVDIICRVFHIKLYQLMQDLKREQPFGKIIACIYTIEFQKRGLPHAHILLFLHPTVKNPSAAHIDKIISAEIPNINVDPDGYNAVKKFMIHGPCGKLNTKSPCMMKDKCTKHFLKKFNDKTTIDTDSFPIYKRRDTGIRVEKKNILLDNRYVVPYHRNLIVKFDAHINVELCNYSRSIKYLFKYVHKGSDRTTATVESIDNTEGIDEIKTYLDCRYISATEACWRIFQFDIHYRKPLVERLPFHLPGEHTVIFGEDKCPENVLGTPGVDKTKFTELLKTNKNNEDARELTYSDFPTCWVWNSKDKIWTRRKQGIAIGRIYFAHPSTGERFYMRMMLNFVKGCTSYESIRTVNEVTYSTFKGACYALGLLDDDKEWIDCLTEAALWATGNKLRHLFVTILINCQVSDVTKLWKSNYTILSEDITALQRKRFKMKDLQLNDQQVEAYTLFEIECIMQKMGKSLKDIDGMPQPNSSLMRETCNRLVNEELDYDTKQLKILHDKSFALLNPSQKISYEAILNSVENEEGKLFFISGHGGTGKTFLWNTVIAKLRSESKIVLSVATSGITALLLPNGRTAHSRFHIPLEVTTESTCEIRHGTLLAELLMQTSLIIWDEAPMANKYCFKALDKTLRDILRTRYENSTTKPFGGLTIICGGDFRQILPVVPKGTRADIVDASLNSSYLWPFFKIYELKQNMRLYNGNVNEDEVAKIASFDKWLLQIGDGSLYHDIDREFIKIPSDIYRRPSNHPMNSIVEAIYPSLLHNYSDPTYLKERAILTPKNEMVHELHEMIMNMIPGEGRT
uniref:ATP-dependent DNA helicase n=1 Tax=Cannabis sativa TaxID=3483 RepID=A0A803NJP1_CANSA